MLLKVLNTCCCNIRVNEFDVVMEAYPKLLDIIVNECQVSGELKDKFGFERRDEAVQQLTKFFIVLSIYGILLLEGRYQISNNFY